jgi:hypothetical protein
MTPARTAKSCGPDASTLASTWQWSWRFTPGMVARKPDHQGEREAAVKTIACGNAGDPGATVVANSCGFVFFHARLRVQRRPAFPRALS